MPLNNYRLKLRKNKDADNDGSPQYSLRYNNSDNPRQASFSILSSLIGNNDVIVIMSTEFFPRSGNSLLGSFDKFLEHVRSLGLLHDYRSTPTVKKQSFFGFQTQMKKTVDVREVSVYVPNQVWTSNFSHILPLCGARYLVTKTAMSVASFMKGILDMPEDIKATTFSIRIFDLPPASLMGISSNELDQAGITAHLGL